MDPDLMRPAGRGHGLHHTGLAVVAQALKHRVALLALVADFVQAEFVWQDIQRFGAFQAATERDKQAWLVFQPGYLRDSIPE